MRRGPHKPNKAVPPQLQACLYLQPSILVWRHNEADNLCRDEYFTVKNNLHEAITASYCRCYNKKREVLRLIVSSYGL